jgi:hypothetical protein
MSFESEYKDLLIKQYWEKPKAAAEIELQATTWKKVYEFLQSFETEFDLDEAYGDRLDIIGRIVGISRILPTDTLLDDDDYRFFIRAKIARNTGSPYLVDEQGESIQSVIQFLFDGGAFVIDNKNMTLTLYVSPDYDVSKLSVIAELGLLPKPQGVRYNFVQIVVGDFFGFADNPEAFGFGDKFDPEIIGGVFAEKIFI